MTTHLTARLAWHSDGWNGKICGKPAENSYCVGSHSYPGNLIAVERSLEWEEENCGKSCSGLDRIPPCCNSINAFGPDEMTAEAAPPKWWNDNSQVRRWQMPPSSICVWPYEGMYNGDVRTGETFDYEKRRSNAKEYWSAIEPNKSLIFYYSNYSNPFSEGESRRYVLVGMSRVKALGEELFYEGCSDETREKYAGGFVWQRMITSCYPDQGLRIPYHLYKDQPDILEKIVLFPENPRVCKYATRHLSDDGALDIVEGFLRSVKMLQELGDRTEDWNFRAQWLEALIGDLWKNRGLYPGMCSVLEVLSLNEAIPFFKEQTLQGKEQDAADTILSFLQERTSEIPSLDIDSAQKNQIFRQWKLRGDDEQRLLMEVFPRFDLMREQIENILAENRESNGIVAELSKIADNPYILSEQYEGNNPDDLISWSTIDRGMICSPELGGDPLIETNSPYRLRALLVEKLRRELTHVFVPADQLIDYVNLRLSILPDWRRFEFRENYIDADERELSEALQVRREGDRRFLYLKAVFEDERLLEDKLSWLMGGPDIELRKPITADTWNEYLYKPGSDLAQKEDIEYRKVIQEQIEACQRIFIRPLSILTGDAGTGKTTVIKALIKAIKKEQGVGAVVIALAPTGKAADRIREVLEEDNTLGSTIEVTTIHSFLAKRGWLNKNMTFKRRHGQREEVCTTYILDEASMLDLALAACFFRAVNWNSVKRLILVGDPNQLPPIGRGCVFSDSINRVRHVDPDGIADLKSNLRQLQGRVAGQGTGIIDLAKCYVQIDQDIPKDGEKDIDAENLLQHIQEGGDIDKDLRVIYWNNQQELNDFLLEEISQDMAGDIYSRNIPLPEKTRDIWRTAFNGQPSYMQILTPCRGEYYGVEELNRVCQAETKEFQPGQNNISEGGIMLFDKVIQKKNRPQSNPIMAYHHNLRENKKIEIFNGQLGFVLPYPRDKNRWRSSYFRLNRFSVAFERRESFSVGYGRNSVRGRHNESIEENLELAYAISVHKAQGSEFGRTYVIIPNTQSALLSRELFYTALTRAKNHCTLLIEKDISPLLDMRRLERAKLNRINTSLFKFKPVPGAMLNSQSWMAEYRIHHTLFDILVRSKSEVIIANMLHEREIPFAYEAPLYAPDGSFFLPDFTIIWRGSEYYWEHLGLLHRADYHNHWNRKRDWYEKHFPNRLITTEEGGDLSVKANEIINSIFI